MACTMCQNEGTRCSTERMKETEECDKVVEKGSWTNGNN